jgi:hypothetical protein
MTTGKPGREIGEDGWPIDLPSEVEQAAEAKQAESRLQQELESALGRLQGGDIEAFADAFADAIELYWRRYPTQFPRALVEASKILVKRATMTGQEKHAHRVWTKHFTRWEAVAELLERGPGLLRLGQANLAQLRKSIAVKPTDEEGVKERARLLERLPEFLEAAADDRGVSVENASRALSKALKATEARAPGWRTVKASYELVNKLGGWYATFQLYQLEMRALEEKKKSRRQKKKAANAQTPAD